MPYKVSFIIILLSFLVFAGSSQQIWIDEDFSDWDNEMILYSDQQGDGAFNGVDFGKVWISNDDDYLFLRFETGKELNLQSSNRITLYLDADNNFGTGFQTEGIGAEIIYAFGDRDGTVYFDNNSYDIGHDDIGLITLPTVTSTVFEIAIRRQSNIFSNTLDLGAQIQFVLLDDRFTGDRVPEGSGSLMFEIDPLKQQVLPPYSLFKDNPDQLRILSHNVLFDGLFGPRKPAFERILAGLMPDIIGFQEIYDHSAFQTAQIVEQAIPLPNGQNWYYAKAQPDVIAVSKYPIKETFEVNGTGIFKIDLGDVDLIFVVAHLPCCDNDADRQEEVDALMAFLRESMTEPSVFQIPFNSPIVIAGDMNLVGNKRQRETLIEGDILDENSYGSDFHPDWDGTDLEDAKPFTTGFPFTITWDQSSSSFSPGRLDYIFYSGSAIFLENTFALQTSGLTQSQLSALGLFSSDASVASDHLALIADFSFDNTTATFETPGATQDLLLYPNPATHFITLEFDVELPANSRITIFDLSGRAISTRSKEMPDASVRIEVSKLQPGIYLCQLDTGREKLSRSFIIK